MTAPVALAGIQSSDLVYISWRVAVIAVVAAGIGVLALRMLAGRSVSMMLIVVSVVTVVTTLGGVAVIALRMLAGVNRDVVIDLLVFAAAAGFVVAWFIGRRISIASRLLLGAVQEVGESGVYVPPSATLPAEFGGLSDELAVAYDRLSRARERERALEASRRELVAWVSQTRRDQIAAITLGEVNGIAAKYFSSPNYVLATVSPQ